jgi:hypothetical protein
VINRSAAGYAIEFPQDSGRILGGEEERQEGQGQVQETPITLVPTPRTRGAATDAKELLARHRHQHRPHEGSLEALWLWCCETVLGGYQKPLTMKERGQLKYLHQCLGPVTRDVIEYAITQWAQFTYKAAFGVSSYPFQPHVGFLLAHHEVAVNLLMPVKVVQSISEPMPQRTPPPVTPIEPPYELTWVELQKMLDGLKE